MLRLPNRVTRSIGALAYGRSGGWLAVGALSAISAAVIVGVGTHLTFFNDEWSVLFQRPGFSSDTLFSPSNEHLIVLDVLIYKGLVAAFGLATQVPYRLVLALAVVALAVGVFVGVRERLGALLGICAAALLLFLGPAWEDLLWSFQVAVVGSVATGVWALHLLEGDRIRRDIAACALLIVSISFSNLGVPFVIGSMIAVLVSRRLTRLWIAGIPGILFGIWWIAYGHTSQSHLSARNISHLPGYVARSAGAGVTSLTGLPDAWGLPLLVPLGAALAVWLYRRRPPIGWAAVIAATALSFWILAGANYVPGREPVASRYRLVSGALLLLLGAELFRTGRLARGVISILVAATALAVVANLGDLKSGYDLLRMHGAVAKSDLGALEIMRGRVAPSFQLLSTVARDPYLRPVQAGPYLRETHAHGSPAYTPAQIQSASSAQRQAADSVLIAGYALHLASRSGSLAPTRRSSCSVIAGDEETAVRPGGTLLIANHGPDRARISLRRFASIDDGYVLGEVPPGGSASLRFPRDRAPQPWRARLRGDRVEVCLAR